MTTVIPQVENATLVNNAEFVKMTVTNMDNTTTIYTFSSSYQPETIDGQVFTPLGGLMNVGLQQRDIRASSFDTSISLSGIGPENIYEVLATKIKGSLVSIWRGFYNTNFILENTVPRFDGIITSYTISEDLNIGDRTDTFLVTLNCSSFKTILENRIAGRLTSPKAWNEYPNPPSTLDNSLINLPNLINAHLDFGMPVTNQGSGI